MALNLTQGKKYKYDGSEIQILDTTQTCNDVADGKWSDGSNPARSARCLITWGKYTDSTSAESYLKYEDQYIGTFEELAAAPGAALADTDQSVFKAIAVGDGDYTFYMQAIEQYDNANIPGAPTEGQVYYNTDTSKIYIYTTAWNELTATSFFTYLEADSTKSECAVLVMTLLLIQMDKMIHDWEECLMSRDCDSATKFYDIQYMSTRMEGASGDFYGGMKPTARKTIKQLNDKFC